MNILVIGSANADLVIHKPIGATFSRVMEELGYGC
jgi:hypothetical protein